jgi:predicted double-glycine peptidase
MGHKNFYFPHFNSKMDKNLWSYYEKEDKREKPKLHNLGCKLVILV